MLNTEIDFTHDQIAVVMTTKHSNNVKSLTIVEISNP